MRAWSARNSFAIFALISSSVHASPAIPRQVTEDGLDPWVSVNANGTVVATITPTITTINGAETTLNAAPASLTATLTSTSGGSHVSTTSGAALPTSTGGGAFQVCHNKDGPFAPFCKPDNGSSVYVGETYYVTWDTTYLPELNGSILIQANYANTSNNHGPQAYQSPLTANNLGFLPLTINETWLQNLPSNNITLYFFPTNPLSTEPASIAGPTLTVTNPPPDIYRQPPTQAPTGKSLYIALPAVAGFVLLCLMGGCWYNRKTRVIGIGNVMGRRKGYGVGKSRRQRVGGRGGRKGDDIMLREQELTAGGQYRDRPT